MNAYPHRIRLRGPWLVEPIAGAGDSSSFSVNLPSTWQELPSQLSQDVFRLKRHFGFPGRLDDSERVWITGRLSFNCPSVVLNGARLGSGTSPLGIWEYEITKLLEKRNVLTLEQARGLPDSLVGGEIALEIRRTAYLKNVAITREGENVAIKGEVAGESATPLDLYLLYGRKNIDNQALTIKPGGAPFEFSCSQSPPTSSDDGSESGWRVELVGGSVIWDVWSV